jgi:hypothetical protein
LAFWLCAEEPINAGIMDFSKGETRETTAWVSFSFFFVIKNIIYQNMIS